MARFFKKNFSIILFSLVFLIGFGIMLYPAISNYVNKQDYAGVIVSYSSDVNKTSNTDSKKIIEAARRYNKKLVKSSIVDAFSYPDHDDTSTDYNSLLNVNSTGVMGYISIPKIDVRIPIYHGATSKVLQKGVGHFEGSSLPVGGEGSHAVLSAHRGLPSARLFTDLDQLRKGDTFYIYVMDEILAYEVDKISVINPSDISLLDINEKGDFITLITCTPYGVNTHRLLVRGTRVEYNKNKLAEAKVDKKLNKVDIIFYICLALSIVVLITAIVIIVRINIKYKNNKFDFEII